MEKSILDHEFSVFFFFFFFFFFSPSWKSIYSTRFISIIHVANFIFSSNKMIEGDMLHMITQ
ncbi:hypothetical protein P175DRAFT_09626 [Aspergillus ochraceoroseus IBT 24754]|uniref:Uncharacterized protein n=1 Tax=Aspergillus ochraceoroseus IBT 24754 TaxID=1392256 RepID=A0A2T5M5T1_9EURO|nr:uncharacterized protein P175DRAFT_09626 [Aspergillus ochraceoroseus IBT 24754]PTU23887.1 hypothetical protein P175DRAFT_09626 [Aspergillus ochraceoroseus IBT 24754]